MATDRKNTIANQFLDLYDSIAPAGSLLQIRSGAAPGAEVGATGTLLAEITLPATPWAAASGGSKSAQGLWQVNAVGSGTAGHFRLTDSGGACIEEGSVGVTGSGADLELQNTSINAGQQVTVTSWARTLT